MKSDKPLRSGAVCKITDVKNILSWLPRAIRQLCIIRLFIEMMTNYKGQRKGRKVGKECTVEQPLPHDGKIGKKIIKKSPGDQIKSENSDDVVNEIGSIDKFFQNWSNQVECHDKAICSAFKKMILKNPSDSDIKATTPTTTKTLNRGKEVKGLTKTLTHVNLLQMYPGIFSLRGNQHASSSITVYAAQVEPRSPISPRPNSQPEHNRNHQRQVQVHRGHIRFGNTVPEFASRNVGYRVRPLQMQTVAREISLEQLQSMTDYTHVIVNLQSNTIEVCDSDEE